MNDMSFVGPRPLLVEYLKKYSKYEKRHLVKPGITGLINPEPSGLKSWIILVWYLLCKNISFFRH